MDINNNTTTEETPTNNNNNNSVNMIQTDIYINDMPYCQVGIDSESNLASLRSTLAQLYDASEKFNSPEYDMQIRYLTTVSDSGGDDEDEDEKKRTCWKLIDSEEELKLALSSSNNTTLTLQLVVDPKKVVQYQLNRAYAYAREFGKIVGGGLSKAFLSSSSSASSASTSDAAAKYGSESLIYLTTDSPIHLDNDEDGDDDYDFVHVHDEETNSRKPEDEEQDQKTYSDPLPEVQEQLLHNELPINLVAPKEEEEEPPVQPVVEQEQLLESMHDFEMVDHSMLLSRVAEESAQQQQQQELEESNSNDDTTQSACESYAPITYIQELQNLNDMGFANNELNLTLLQKHSGNLVAVVTELLNQLEL